MSTKFETMTKDMERLNNYAEHHHDWPFEMHTVRSLIVSACNAGSFVGSNSVSVHSIERVDEETVTFKATIKRTSDSMKIKGVSYCYVSISNVSGPLVTDPDFDAEARMTIYWTLDE